MEALAWIYFGGVFVAVVVMSFKSGWKNPTNIMAGNHEPDLVITRDGFRVPNWKGGMFSFRAPAKRLSLTAWVWPIALTKWFADGRPPSPYLCDFKAVERGLELGIIETYWSPGEPWPSPNAVAHSPNERSR